MIVERFSPYAELACKLLPMNSDEGDGSHDVSHIERVWANAKRIQAEEGGDPELVAAAVLLHDCFHVPKNSPLRSSASKLAAEKAGKALEALSWEQPRIQIVTGAILTHSFSAGLTPTSLEGRILQDADRLDAIGFNGIARCFYSAGRMGSRLYDGADPLGAKRALDDRSFALDHFPLKLLKLAEGFQTAAGRRLAAERSCVLHNFYDGMVQEIGDEPAR
ncbi:MAG TPA: HD domain-containing protein [Candidatus Baltobacteraceae bacterium]|nr:HD domain-containing protein [Candidatus Baltobacteraceae bacterium]